MIQHWFCDVSKKRLSAKNFQDHNSQEGKIFVSRFDSKDSVELIFNHQVDRNQMFTEFIVKKRVFTPRKQIWICKIAIKTTFSSHRILKVESLILMFFWSKKWTKLYAFSFEKAKKVGEKRCFYTKEANLNLQNCYKNPLFFPPKS